MNDAPTLERMHERQLADIIAAALREQGFEPIVGCAAPEEFIGVCAPRDGFVVLFDCAAHVARIRAFSARVIVHEITLSGDAGAEHTETAARHIAAKVAEFITRGTDRA